MNFKIITGSVDVHANERSKAGKLIEDKISKYIHENQITNIQYIHPVQVQWREITHAYDMLYFSLTIILNDE